MLEAECVSHARLGLSEAHSQIVELIGALSVLPVPDQSVSCMLGARV